MQKFVYETPPEGFESKVEVAKCFCQFGDKILLVQRNDEKVLGGTWSIPGGKIDKNETKLESVTRELREETGIDLEEKDFAFIKKIYIRSEKNENLGILFSLDFIMYIFKTTFEKKPEIKLCKKEHQNFKWATQKEALKLNLIPGSEEYLKMVYP